MASISLFLTNEQLGKLQRSWKTNSAIDAMELSPLGRSPALRQLLRIVFAKMKGHPGIQQPLIGLPGIFLRNINCGMLEC